MSTFRPVIRCYPNFQLIFKLVPNSSTIEVPFCSVADGIDKTLQLVGILRLERKCEVNLKGNTTDPRSYLNRENDTDFFFSGIEKKVSLVELSTRVIETFSIKCFIDECCQMFPL